MMPSRYLMIRQALCEKFLSCETERNELQQIYATYEEKIETLEMSQVALEELMIKKEEELKCAMVTIGLWNKGSKTLDNIIGSQQICSDKSGIGFGDKKEQKQSASTSHATRTQGKGAQKFNMIIDFSIFLELVRSKKRRYILYTL
mgnify:CR=1 FL=1